MCASLQRLTRDSSHLLDSHQASAIARAPRAFHVSRYNRPDGAPSRATLLLGEDMERAKCDSLDLKQIEDPKNNRTCKINNIVIHPRACPSPPRHGHRPTRHPPPTKTSRTATSLRAQW